MLKNTPGPAEMIKLVGSSRFERWQGLCAAIDERYEAERRWNSGGKKWTYEYKYRRGGKTLCALYAKENCIGFMIIFGKNEREKFEAIRAALPDEICRTYDAATTYHDGKWVMFDPANTDAFADYMKLLAIKRKPNRK